MSAFRLDEISLFSAGLSDDTILNLSNSLGIAPPAGPTALSITFIGVDCDNSTTFNFSAIGNKKRQKISGRIPDGYRKRILRPIFRLFRDTVLHGNCVSGTVKGRRT